MRRITKKSKKTAGKLILDSSKLKQVFPADKPINKNKPEKADNIDNIFEENKFENFVNFFSGAGTTLAAERPVENIERDLREVEASNSGRKDDTLKYFSSQSEYFSSVNFQSNTDPNYQLNSEGSWNNPNIQKIHDRRTGDIEILGIRNNFRNPDSDRFAQDYNRENEKYNPDFNIKEIENERTLPGERRKASFK